MTTGLKLFGDLKAEKYVHEEALGINPKPTNMQSHIYNLHKTVKICQIKLKKHAIQYEDIHNYYLASKVMLCQSALHAVAVAF